MKIAVCSHDMQDVEQLRRFWEKRHKFQENIKFDYFQDEEKLVTTLQHEQYDLLLIFSELKENVERLVKVREACKDGIFTLVSADREIKRRAVGYRSKKYVGEFNRKQIVLDVNDIYGLDSYKRITNIHLKKEKIRINGKLDDEEKKLPEDLFIRISQGSIVNMSFIRQVDGTEIILDNGEVFYVSVRRKHEFLERYRRYLEESYGVKDL